MIGRVFIHLYIILFINLILLTSSSVKSELNCKYNIHACIYNLVLLIFKVS